MELNVDCIYNYRGRSCTNKNIKKSLMWGGKRACVIFPGWNEECDYKAKHPRKKQKKGDDSYD